MKLYLSDISKNEIYKSELLVIITGIILALGPLSKINHKELRKKNFSAIYYKEDKIDIKNSLEKINREMGAELRGKYGTHRGNEIIRSMAEAKDRCKYPLWGRD